MECPRPRERTRRRTGASCAVAALRREECARRPRGALWRGDTPRASGAAHRFPLGFRFPLVRARPMPDISDGGAETEEPWRAIWAPCGSRRGTGPRHSGFKCTGAQSQALNVQVPRDRCAVTSTLLPWHRGPCCGRAPPPSPPSCCAAPRHRPRPRRAGRCLRTRRRPARGREGRRSHRAVEAPPLECPRAPLSAGTPRTVGVPVAALPWETRAAASPHGGEPRRKPGSRRRPAGRRRGRSRRRARPSRRRRRAPVITYE